MLSDLFGADVATQLTPPTVYVHIALLFYVIGFLTRDELMLRIQVLTGTFFYILYYYFISDAPLWEAILASMAIAAANLYSSFIIIHERSTMGMSSEDIALYQKFNTLKPGHFRRIMKNAQRRHMDTDTVLLDMGQSVDKLFYLRSGEVEISRGGKIAAVKDGHFFGELSFLKGTPASATVMAKAGADVIIWDQKTLQAIMEKSPVISNAIIALFNEDLAAKLMVNWPDDTSKGKA
ncbi:MAG: cyclic nucleotide-binding domain-containing protein [Pseudomonadota bacterium]